MPLEHQIHMTACMQGLMEAALHARTASMASALRRVLGGLHSAKSAPGVDALLLRLYQPILFRALSAANPAVRRNALGLLVDAFPLQVDRWASHCFALPCFRLCPCRCTSVMRCMPYLGSQFVLYGHAKDIDECLANRPLP